jgi:hypothetical protein
MKRVLAVMLLGAVLLAGCGRARGGGRAVEPSPVSTPPSTSAPAVSPSISVDKELTSVDGLLKSLDDQLNADDNGQPDAD